ncbi:MULTISPECIES: hypothetical protein [unclassified Dietzia]|uniref:hypothetical protein n=1 Tax=unclassified Dietzia TaxID=2617939 RepID=UPI0015FC6A21|nr:MULTISPECIES: hypothetical protein [unclassified Dietzia]MBB1023332.1 hypothetical protein [Dietzia sp. DQ12-76]MBB1026489.1 hypothetical protein [Dietzia sp. DQ11-38-2]
MMSRFSVSSLVAAHWKGLTQPSNGAPPKPDWVARGVLCVGAFVAMLAGFVTRADLGEPALRLAAFALLTGSLLTVFSQLASFRLKLTEWFDADDLGHRVEKDMVDESVAHVLFAAVLSLLAAGVTAVGALLPQSEGLFGAIAGSVLAGVTFALVYYVVGLVVITLPRLYAAYVSVNDVDRSLNGIVKDNRLRPMRRT